MSKAEEVEAIEAILVVATANVALIAQVLVETERQDVFDDLCVACGEMREVAAALHAMKASLVVDSLEGAGEGGMAS